MTVEAEGQLATAMAKLARKEVPLKIQVRQYQLPALRLERDGLLKAIAARADTFKAKVLPDRWVPEKRRLQELESEIAKAETEYIDALLMPLSVADEQERDAHYFYALNNLRKHPPELKNDEAKKEWEDAVNFTANHSMCTKWVECALRVERDEEYHRALTLKQVRALDPRILMDIINAYKAAFELTESELGKSVAPSPAA